MDIRLLNWSM